MTKGPHPPMRAPLTPGESRCPRGHTIRPPGEYMQHVECHLCARPSGDDAYACTACAETTRAALHRITDGLDEDLTITLAKQGTKPENTGGGRTKASEAPLPLDLRAAEARSILRSTLVTWVRLIHDETGRGSLPADTLPAMAAWLEPLTGWLRHRDYGPEALDELTTAVAQALRAIDTPQRRVFVCQCRCGEYVYAREDAPAATCPETECGTVWGVREQREWMGEYVEGHLLGAADMARAVSRPGDPVSASTIRSWARRRKITPHGPDGQPLEEGETARSPRYLVSEVLERLVERAVQEEARIVA